VSGQVVSACVVAALSEWKAYGDIAEGLLAVAKEKASRAGVAWEELARAEQTVYVEVVIDEFNRLKREAK
jgi:hypothetical protein